MSLEFTLLPSEEQEIIVGLHGRTGGRLRRGGNIYAVYDGWRYGRGRHGRRSTPARGFGTAATVGRQRRGRIARQRIRYPRAATGQLYGPCRGGQERAYPSMFVARVMADQKSHKKMLITAVQDKDILLSRRWSS